LKATKSLLNLDGEHAELLKLAPPELLLYPTWLVLSIMFIHRLNAKNLICKIMRLKICSLVQNI